MLNINITKLNINIIMKKYNILDVRVVGHV